MEYFLSLVPIAILIVGIFGNLVNILIFAKKPMRSLSPYKFLLYLSSFDLIVLIIGGTEILLKSNFTMGLREFSLFSCNIQKFLTYSTTYISSCVSIALSINRAQTIYKLSVGSKEINQNGERLSTNDISNQEELISNSKKMSTTPSSIQIKRHYLLFFLYNRTSRRKSKKERNHVNLIIFLIVAFTFLLNAHFIFLLKPTSIVFIERNGTRMNFTTEKLNELKKVTLSTLIHIHILRC